jgi:hypothetical protein
LIQYFSLHKPKPCEVASKGEVANPPYSKSFGTSGTLVASRLGANGGGPSLVVGSSRCGSFYSASGSCGPGLGSFGGICSSGSSGSSASGKGVGGIGSGGFDSLSVALGPIAQPQESFLVVGQS